MDRHIVYPGQIPLDTDILNLIKDAYYGDGWLASTTIGTSTVVSGLAVTPTSPASLQVNVAPGAIYSLQTVDSAAFGSLGTDANQIVKQGVSKAGATLTITPPGTVGQSINYLVQVAFSEVDGTPVVLPYYNASDPAVAWAGPNNSGTAQNTIRKDTCVISLKAGTPAATGSQTTPAPDAGYTGIYVITVANGATSITSGNISLLSTAPFVTPLGLIPSSVQSGIWNYGVAGGTANALTLTLTPAPASLTALVGALIKVKSGSSANTGAMTININGLGAVAITTETGAPMVAGAVPANSIFYIAYDGTQFQKISGNLSASLDAAGRVSQKAAYVYAVAASTATFLNGTASLANDFTTSESALDDATFSGGVLTFGANTAGVWLIMANLGIQTPFNGWTSKPTIRKNTSTIIGWTETPCYGTALGGNTPVFATARFAAGDTVGAYMIQNTGSSQTNSTLSRFVAMRIGI